MSLIGNIVRSAMDGVKQVAQTAVSGIKDTMKQAIGQLGGIAQTLMAAINQFNPMNMLQGLMQQGARSMGGLANLCGSLQGHAQKSMNQLTCLAQRPGSQAAAGPASLGSAAGGAKPLAGAPVAGGAKPLAGAPVAGAPVAGAPVAGGAKPLAGAPAAGAPQSYGAATTPQSYGAATTPQSYGAATTPQSYGAAGGTPAGVDADTKKNMEETKQGHRNAMAMDKLTADLGREMDAQKMKHSLEKKGYDSAAQHI